MADHQQRSRVISARTTLLPAPSHKNILRSTDFHNCLSGIPCYVKYNTPTNIAPNSHQNPKK